MQISRTYSEAIWLGIFMRLFPDHCDERHRERMTYLRSKILINNIKHANRNSKT
jgi:hypothetical protein